MSDTEKKNRLTGIIDTFGKQSIAVIGDVMLDKYIWGRATRISQEAPVPVVQVKNETAVPGGAANVARNVLSLLGKAKVFGIVGDDQDGKLLEECLKEAGADTANMLKCKERSTTVKTRVLAGNQQVVRIDKENTALIPVAVRLKLQKQLLSLMEEKKIGAVILEDYAKGIFCKSFMEKIVSLAQKYNVITALDPHPNNPFNVKGLTFMTPNRSEAFALAGIKYAPGCGNPLKDAPLQKVADALMKKWQPKYLLITLGAEGMALYFQNGDAPLHIPTQARQVFDVSGAGDTVMATMMLSLMSGATPEEAATIANQAAGIVVGRVGTSAIEADVLRKKIVE